MCKCVRRYLHLLFIYGDLSGISIFNNIDFYQARTYKEALPGNTTDLHLAVLEGTKLLLYHFSKEFQWVNKEKTFSI